MDYTWDEMIKEFRALGGTADNIVQANGPLGFGIFPVDRYKPISLHVPVNLLIPVEDVEFLDGRMMIRNSADVGQAEREFFEKYENVFSWGRARSECATFVEDLNNLPPEVTSALHLSGELERLTEEGVDPAGQWFLKSRKIGRIGKMFVMPVMELVNHGLSASPYNLTDGVSIQGQFSDEVHVHYAIGDPLGIFLGFGFASPERMAFSLPATREGPRSIVIERNINFKSMRGSVPIPDYKIEGDQVLLSCMMIGNAKAPRISKGIFVSIMKEAAVPNSEEEFDIIVHQNRMKFLELLDMLEPVQGELGSSLRRTIRFQLAAISHCIGMREL